MYRKIILFLLSIVFVFSYHFAYASIIINEIMYDLDGGDIDWVEVINKDDIDIDLSSLKLLISNSPSNHTINSYLGDSILSSQGYGVIVVGSVVADFVSKWGNAGNIFTSSFSLPNDTAKVEINAGDKTQPISSVDYDFSQGAGGDGNSLQLVNNSWVATSPTPGAENETSLVEDNETGEGNSSTTESNTSSSGSSSSTSTKKITAPKETEKKVKIIAPKVTFLNIPFEIKGEITDEGGTKLKNGRYFWNFGDGNSKEMRSSESFLYTYFYEGEYVISLEYYSKIFSQIPDSTTEFIIKVVPMNVAISRVGDTRDFFVELSNNTNYEIDISEWMLSSLDKVFIFPRNSSILPKKKIILSSKITNFNLFDEKNLKLNTKTGQLVFDYRSSSIGIKNTATKQIKKPKSDASIISAETEILENKMLVSTEGLSALVTQNDVVKSEFKSSYTKIIPLISFVFIGASAGAVYVIRRKKIVPETGDDFEILDE